VSQEIRNYPLFNGILALDFKQHGRRDCSLLSVPRRGECAGRWVGPLDPFANILASNRIFQED